MSAADLLDLSIAELAPLLRDRKVSPVEVVQAALDRIAKVDDRLNAFITVTGEQAIAAARQDFEVKWWWKYGQPKIDLIRATLEVDSRALGAVVNEVMHLNRAGIQTTLEAFPNGFPNPEVFRLELKIQKPV